MAQKQKDPGTWTVAQVETGLAETNERNVAGVTWRRFLVDWHYGHFVKRLPHGEQLSFRQRNGVTEWRHTMAVRISRAPLEDIEALEHEQSLPPVKTFAARFKREQTNPNPHGGGRRGKSEEPQPDPPANDSSLPTPEVAAEVARRLQGEDMKRYVEEKVQERLRELSPSGKHRLRGAGIHREEKNEQPVPVSYPERFDRVLDEATDALNRLLQDKTHTYNKSTRSGIQTSAKVEALEGALATLKALLQPKARKSRALKPVPREDIPFSNYAEAAVYKSAVEWYAIEKKLKVTCAHLSRHECVIGVCTTEKLPDPDALVTLYREHMQSQK